MKHIKQCPVCHKEYTTYRERQRTCSKKCMGIYQTGQNNPNYGNKWTKEQRQHLSDYQKTNTELSKRVKQDWKNNPERRKKAAQIMSKTMKDLFLKNPEKWSKPHSEESKLKIGKASSKKFTDEFRAKHRATMESLGYWRTVEELDSYEVYFKEAEWTEKMWDIVDSDLLKTYGIFNTKTNTRGCVRDHMFGRREGHRLNVPPILLRHPANCEIILNSQNVRKSKDGDVSKSLEQLFIDIKNYTKEWKEQKECLKAIEEYTNR